MLGRAPLASGWAGRAAAGAAALVACVAALASFSHVRHVALEVGESELVAWVLPLSVDGLAVVCSVALVEINRQLRNPTPTHAVEAATDPDAVTTSDRTPAPSASVNGHRPLVLFNSSTPNSSE